MFSSNHILFLTLVWVTFSLLVTFLPGIHLPVFLPHPTLRPALSIITFFYFFISTLLTIICPSPPLTLSHPLSIICLSSLPGANRKYMYHPYHFLSNHHNSLKRRSQKKQVVSNPWLLFAVGEVNLFFWLTVQLMTIIKPEGVWLTLISNSSNSICKLASVQCSSGGKSSTKWSAFFRLFFKAESHVLFISCIHITRRVKESQVS